MAIEEIIGSLLEFHGFMVKYRVPFKITQGFGDLDVVALDLQTNKILVVECKAYGSPETYYNYSAPANKRQVDEQISTLCENIKRFEVIKHNFPQNTSLGGVLGVYPGCFAESDRKNLEQNLSERLGVKIAIYSIHEVLLSLVKAVQDDMFKRRKRYPTTVLEFIRWLIRTYSVVKNPLEEILVEAQSQISIPKTCTGSRVRFFENPLIES